MGVMVSLIIPCRNEAFYIKGLIESLLAQEYPREKMEVLFVDGCSEDSTKELIWEYGKDLHELNILNNSQRIVPVALNIGIKASRGELIIRLDAHCFYPSDYISKLVKWSLMTNADNVGGICFSKSKSDTSISNAICIVSSDRLGVGNSRFRVGVDKIQDVDTVPFGCFKREIFERIGLFNESLIRGQDYEFNRRIKSSGGRIVLVPEISCVYFPRETLWELWKNRFNTGKWVVAIPYYTKSFNSITIRHFIPLVFITVLFILLVLASFSRFFGYCLYGILLLYISTLSYKCILLRSPKTIPFHLFLSFITMHFSYGFGSVTGLASICYQATASLFKRRKIKYSEKL